MARCERWNRLAPEAVEAEFGSAAGWYLVESERKATHTGAAGEIATVVLIFLGLNAAEMLRNYHGAFAGRLGEASADALLEWARRKSAERRRSKGLSNADGPPDFAWSFDGPSDPKLLGQGMLGELADVLGIAQDRLELVRAERTPDLSMFAIYRDADTGRSTQLQ